VVTKPDHSVEILEKSPNVNLETQPDIKVVRNSKTIVDTGIRQTLLSLMPDILFCTFLMEAVELPDEGAWDFRNTDRLWTSPPERAWEREFNAVAGTFAISAGNYHALCYKCG